MVKYGSGHMGSCSSSTYQEQKIFEITFILLLAKTLRNPTKLLQKIINKTSILKHYQNKTNFFSTIMTTKLNKFYLLQGSGIFNNR